VGYVRVVRDRFLVELSARKEFYCVRLPHINWVFCWRTYIAKYVKEKGFSSVFLPRVYFPYGAIFLKLILIFRGWERGDP
jgi:hypothetical protein